MNKHVVSAILWAAVVLFAWYHESNAFKNFANVRNEFDSVSEGQSKTSVVRRLGKPTYHEGRCGVIARISTGCTVEFVYGHPFSPLTADYYLVEFNDDDTVIATRHWIAP